MVPIILSGVRGNRLWPLSRYCFPNQFVSLLSDSDLLNICNIFILSLKNFSKSFFKSIEHKKTFYKINLF
ncbi:MAG: hypothetical protein CBC84_001715 [Pelagibacteraceae bacterium TMED124]|nr:MAG: hypothetical protein CBC84_001715 [Pelagibacteraceae bacterium TMED124]